ncbi:MAG: COG4315 family predicted lipoprotein [Solirubrobacterales bacterium]
MTRLLAIATTCALLAIGAGCGGDDDDSSSEDASAATTTTTEASKSAGGGNGGGKPERGDAGSGSVVEVSDSEFGQILTDSDGRTLYLFDKETTERSECFGACAEAWPPFYTEGEPRAGSGVKDELLGTTDHEGKELVTYNGQPLYYYVDEGPNEVLCQGVDEFGGLWLVVDPSGDAIQ